MQFILVEKSEKSIRRYNLIGCSEDLSRMYARVPVSFIDRDLVYMLVPAEYIKSSLDFENQALINTVILENSRLCIAQNDWRKYVTSSGNPDITHYMYHTHAYFRRNVHILSLRTPERKEELRVFEFGSLEDKKRLAWKWQMQSFTKGNDITDSRCLLHTKFGKAILRELESADLTPQDDDII